MNNKNEKDIYRFLLVAAKSRNKLQNIARTCDLTRISLSEFIRSGYLGRDKIEKLKNWIISNNYLPNNINEQEYYKLLLFFLLSTFNELAKIPSYDPLEYVEEKEKKYIKDLPSSKEVLNMSTPIDFKQLKILYKCLQKSFQNLGLEEGRKIWNDIKKYIISQNDLFKLPVENYLKYLIYTIIGKEQVHPNERELAIRFVLQKKLIDEKIIELNKAIPPITGPIVSCDYFCEKCNKWSPTTGKFCMHCGMKIKTERLCEESFKTESIECLAN